ncbi:MAG: SMI1/KNR4 family protein [Pseudomonadales bacterium]|nr:SMI1/KNR4 family protein [Pseudomonadales bacterium]
MIFKTKDRTKELLDNIWCDDYYIVAAGESAPTEKDIKAFAKRQGVKFSKEYIAHSSNYFGGLYLEVKEEIWPRAKAGDVGPFWSFLYGITTYAYSDEAPDWMNIEIVTSEFNEMGHNVVPILKVMGDSDVYCFDQNGSIVQWSHELDEFEPYDGDFYDLLSYEIQELEQRRLKKIEKA